MTKEERLQWLKQIEKDIYVSSLESTFADDMKSCAIHSVIEELEKEPETGHWILLDECANSGYYCSKCHKKVVKEGWSDTVKKIKHCPNCGVKILEGKNG